MSGYWEPEKWITIPVNTPYSRSHNSVDLKNLSRRERWVRKEHVSTFNSTKESMWEIWAGFTDHEVGKLDYAGHVRLLSGNAQQWFWDLWGIKYGMTCYICLTEKSLTAV